MSSWIVARNFASKKKEVQVNYFDVSNTTDMLQLYMDYLAMYIYSKKIGEPCSIFDPSNVLKNTLRVHPQIKYLKDIPEVSTQLSLESCKSFVETMKFKEIQKIAADILYYTPNFNREVIQVITKAGIKSIFDIGITLVKDITGPNLPAFKFYSEQLKAFQKKMKKDTLNIYIMADSYSIVSQFQAYCDPSWKLTSLSKTVPVSPNDEFIQNMADVQIMSAISSLILDFSRPADKYIYLMQRSKDGMTFFMEAKSSEWKLM